MRWVNRDQISEVARLSSSKNFIYVSCNFLCKRKHRRIVRGTRYDGYQYPYPPLFGLGYRTSPTFQDTGEEFADIRGDLWRSNYTKTVFGRGSAPDPITIRDLIVLIVWSVPNSQACEVCGRACRAKPPNADAPVFFPANMCHNLFLSTSMLLKSGLTISIIRTGNQN